MKSMIAAFVVMGMTGSAVSAVFNGTGSWPTGGDVEIPRNTPVTVTDANVAAVAGWDSLILNDGATLTFANVGTAANLKAVVSGAGRLVATGSKGLTLSGDNRNLSGGCIFTDSAVTIANEYGLGGPQTQEALVTFTKTATVGSLKFHWEGQKAFTNHCPIVYACDSGYTAADGKMYLGSSAADEYFVQDADFYLQKASAGNTKLNFRNNYEQMSGTFGIREHSDYFATAGDENAVVRFTGTTGFWIANSSKSTKDWYILCKGSCSYRYGSTGTYLGGAIRLNVGTVFIDTDNPFPPIAGVTTPVGLTSFNSYPVNQSKYQNCIDLNGHALQLLRLNVTGKPTETTTDYEIISNSSATAATLTLVGNDRGTDYATTPVAYKLTGKVSLTVNNNATNHFWRQVSEVEGTLTVTRGGMVFDHAAGWNGTAVVIDGGAIDARSADSFTSGTASLTITDGWLKLHSGANVSFSTVEIGGTSLNPGDYTVARLRDDYGLGAYVIGDDAAILSVGEAGEWKGWPTTPGAMAYVSRDGNVTLTDADIPKVVQLGGISLGLGSTVSCTVSEPLALSCPVSGFGTFRIVDSASVTLLGDNSQLASPGCFYIENSAVAVSNRFGLGSSQSGAATVVFTTRSLTFGLADCKAFTNDVGISYAGGTGATTVSFGSAAADETLVQNGDFVCNWSDAYARRTVMTGNVEFNGGFRSTKANTYFGAAENARVRFGRTCVIRGEASETATFSMWLYGLKRPTQGRWFFDCETTPKLNHLAFEVADVVCERENVFADGTGNSNQTLNYFRQPASNEAKYMSVFDLNGLNQTVRRFVRQSGADTTYAVITSAVPAVLTVETSDFESNKEWLKFRGAAGFRYCGVGTNLFANIPSESTGSFRVSSGVCGFDLGAAWVGKEIAVDGTGTLYVGSASAPAFGGKADVKARETTLHLADSGRFYLQDGISYVYDAFRGEERIPRGTYTSANCDWVDGNGSLRVLHDDGGMVLIVR